MGLVLRGWRGGWKRPGHALQRLLLGLLRVLHPLCQLCQLGMLGQRRQLQLLLQGWAVGEVDTSHGANLRQAGRQATEPGR